MEKAALLTGQAALRRGLANEERHMTLFKSWRDFVSMDPPKVVPLSYPLHVKHGLLLVVMRGLDGNCKSMNYDLHHEY